MGTPAQNSYSLLLVYTTIQNAQFSNEHPANQQMSHPLYIDEVKVRLIVFHISFGIDKNYKDGREK